jgi:hypothetical protein
MIKRSGLRLGPWFAEPLGFHIANMQRETGDSLLQETESNIANP